VKKFFVSWQHLTLLYIKSDQMRGHLEKMTAFRASLKLKMKALHHGKGRLGFSRQSFGGLLGTWMFGVFW